MKPLAVITGAASGIGRATSLELAEAGYTILAIDRNEKTLNELKTLLSRDDNHLFRVADVSDEAQVHSIFDEIKKKSFVLSVAVNCAGLLGPYKPIQEVSASEWHDLMATNLNGVFFSMKHEIAAMLESGRGSIVNISSALGLVGMPNASTYVASKHAIIGLTKSISLELATKNIRVNAVAPGGVDTPLLRSTTASTPEGLAAIESAHAMKRIAKPEEIAKAVRFLVSDESSFITGSVLCVDGGWTAI